MEFRDYILSASLWKEPVRDKIKYVYKRPYSSN